MKYIIFSVDGGAFPIAHALQKEGNKIYVGQIQDTKDMGVESFISKTENKEQDRRRLSLYDGIFDKWDANKLLKAMEKVKNKDDYFVIFDYNSLYKFGEEVLKMGYTKGLIPTKEDYEREKDRHASQEFVKKNYPDVKVDESHQFKKVDDAIKLIEDSEDFWVIKSNGNFVDTYVPPPGSDIESEKKQMKAGLLANKKLYEKGGFSVEKKIMNLVEIIPEIVFWNGKPVYSQVEIETRYFGAEDIGIQTGGNQNLIVKTKLGDRINEIAFPKAVHEMAKNRKGMFIFDAGLLYDLDREAFYFTEFAGNRWGWGGVFSEFSMSREENRVVSPFFEKIVQGINPISYNFGANLCIFNLNVDDKYPDLFRENQPIFWKEADGKNIFISQMKKIKDEEGNDMIVNVGDKSNVLGYITGYGDDPNSAIQEVYRNLKGFSFKEMFYRPFSDFISHNYQSSVLNRYEFLLEQNLISESEERENPLEETYKENI